MSEKFSWELLDFDEYLVICYDGEMKWASDRKEVERIVAEECGQGRAVVLAVDDIWDVMWLRGR